VVTADEPAASPITTKVGVERMDESHQVFEELHPTGRSGGVVLFILATWLVAAGFLGAAWWRHQAEVGTARLLREEGVVTRSRVLDTRMSSSGKSRSYKVVHQFTSACGARDLTQAAPEI
jgi:hypothetical protein